jgi:2-polyprenyl-3-methyl-5-hydroxy-6-metoxy-1,4-benzoquinol methylase
VEYFKSLFEVKQDDLKTKFTNTYQRGLWSDGESMSGHGSSMIWTENIRTNLVRIIKERKIETIFDCSCGDWNWMKEISGNFQNYTGNDIVEDIVVTNNRRFGNERIRFVNGDMVESLKKLNDKSVDLVICRHTLEHLTLEYCLEVIGQIKRVSKFSLITSTSSSDNDRANKQLTVNGHDARQIHLESYPFASVLGAPVESFWDSEGVEMLVGCRANIYEF